MTSKETFSRTLRRMTENILLLTVSHDNMEIKNSRRRNYKKINSESIRLICDTLIISSGWTAGVRFPAESRDLSLLHKNLTGYDAHPASYLLDTEDSFSGGKAPGE
jgi:hypothetical protein